MIVWTDTLNSVDPRFSTIIWFLWNVVEVSWIVFVKFVGTVDSQLITQDTTMLIDSTVKRI